MAKKKARLGRPPVPDSKKQRRRNRLTIMLWPEERGKLDAAADGNGVSTWARDILLREAGR